MDESVWMTAGQAEIIHSTAQLAQVLRDLRRRDARRRHAREQTYRELAAATGWSHAAIGDYFTGKTVPPTNRFDILVQMLGASPAEQRLLATARDRVGERYRRGTEPVRSGAITLGTSPIVGRDQELALFRQQIDAAAGGRGAATFLLGEGGIGKTRLTAGVAAMAGQAGLTVLSGRATASTVQFRPLSEAILSELRRSGPPRYPDLQPYQAALSGLVPEWRTGHPRPVDESPVVLGEAVLRLVVALGRPRGCLLILEDLHDADEDTMTIVDYLVDNAAAERLLVIGTARPGPGTVMRLVRAAQRRRAAGVVELARLGEAPVRELAASCLGILPDELPEPVVTHLLATADGLPLHIEELLAAMVMDGALADFGEGWRLTGPVAVPIPITIAATLVDRVDRLRPPGPALLQAAALLGRQFPAPVAAAAVGVDDPELFACLRDAVEVRLLAPTSEAQTYTFRHALTAEALRSQLVPLEHAMLARRVAAAVEAHQLGDTDGWQQLLGDLWLAAGEDRKAGEYLAAAGRRAAAEGALSTSIALLERALPLIGGGVPAPALANLEATLIDLYAETGRVADAYALGTRLAREAPAAQRADIHLQLGRVAEAVGDWQRGLADIDEARRLLGPAPDPAMIAQLDVAAAQLMFADAAPDMQAAACQLAEQALRGLDADAQPEVACAALEILGRAARLHDLASADRLSRRALAIAEKHELAGWRIRTLYQLGVHDGIADADPTQLVEALTVARSAGAVVTALDIELELSVLRLCRGEFDLVETVAASCEQTAARLRLAHTRLLALGVRIMAVAHHAQQSSVDELLDEFRVLGGDSLDVSSAVHGFGVAFCHLLNEDAARAGAELEEAVALESARPATYVSYIHGPHLLLSVLAGRAGADACASLTGSAHMQARWNRMFLALAEAVLNSQTGNTVAADKATSEFLTLSACFPLAHHLGLRLVAPVALEAGWGNPLPWLRSAEAYFHPLAPRVARACRRMLRDSGAPVPQHRQGSDIIPVAARRYGITVREYEVLALVAQQLSNQQIARRLYLSARTVEKHIANLLAKTDRADRAELIAFAAELRPTPAP